MERRYAKSIRRLDKQETRLRKSYSKRIDSQYGVTGTDALIVG